MSYAIVVRDISKGRGESNFVLAYDIASCEEAERLAQGIVSGYAVHGNHRREGLYWCCSSETFFKLWICRQ